MNNPVNMSDLSGNWANWWEKTMKVVSAIVVVAAVVTTVVAVSAFTAGTGSAAAVYGATIFLGAALCGINGGVANEAKGNSYTNGYLGGFSAAPHNPLRADFLAEQCGEELWEQVEEQP